MIKTSYDFADRQTWIIHLFFHIYDIKYCIYEQIFTEHEYLSAYGSSKPIIK